MKKTQIPAFTEEDIEFLEDQNLPKHGTPIRLTLSQDYMRQLEHGVKQQFENIARRVINPAFVLCFYCSYEVMQMVKDVYAKYDEYLAAVAPPAEQDTEQPAGEDSTENPDVTGQPGEIPPVKLGDDAAGNPITETITTEAPKSKGGRPKKSTDKHS